MDSMSSLAADILSDAPISTMGDMVLQAYLLGTVDYEAVLGLQRRLVYQVAGDRDTAALLMCEHPPLITVGRHGSRGHIQFPPEDLALRGWPVRWVNRGGGCFLHLPGQFALYPILPLDRLGLGLEAYIQKLHEVVLAFLADFGIRGHTRPGKPGVWVGARPIAGVGIAVRDWVAYHGLIVNVQPDLHGFRKVHYWGANGEPMTSLERERRGPVRPSLVRQQLLDHFTACFGFSRTSLFLEHPALTKKKTFHAVAAVR